jgi:nucleotidyltransferase substrate binding protein (TIGR01987 family)
MEKLEQAKHALRTLSDILKEPFSPIVRDATIQRFEYSSEAVWKAAREWLYANESIEQNHPRGCFRKLYQIGRIDEALSLRLLESIDDRNRTSHAYIEALAEEVYANIPKHLESFQQLLDSLQP